MKQLLYIGNNLEHERSNRSMMGTLGPLLASEGYVVHYASSKSNKALRLMDMLMMVLRQRKKVECVLIDTYSTQNFYYALLVSQLCRILMLPYIPILHGGNLPNRLNNAPNWSKLIFKHAHANVSPSLYLKERFEQFGYQNVVYIPNTISLDNYPPHKKTFDAPRLLWVRSFSSIYNPLMAVRVLKILRDKGLNAQLCMVGPDSDGTLAKVKSLATDLKVEVLFTGKLSKSEWTTLAQAYNVFINTSNVDNTPVSVIEAMALGLPVVSTNVGGMPYLIHHGFNGLLVPPNDENAMVGQIMQLFDQSTKSEMLIANARTKVETFDWDLVKLKWLEVLGKAIFD